MKHAINAHDIYKPYRKIPTIQLLHNMSMKHLKEMKQRWADKLSTLAGRIHEVVRLPLLVNYKDAPQLEMQKTANSKRRKTNFATLISPEARESYSRTKLHGKDKEAQMFIRTLPDTQETNNGRKQDKTNNILDREHLNKEVSISSKRLYSIVQSRCNVKIMISPMQQTSSVSFGRETMPQRQGNEKMSLINAPDANLTIKSSQQQKSFAKLREKIKLHESNKKESNEKAVKFNTITNYGNKFR